MLKPPHRAPNTTSNSTSSPKTPSSPNTNPKPPQRTQEQKDADARRKGPIMASIFNGTFDPAQFANEVPDGKRIFHGELSSHPTSGCHNIIRYQQEAQKRQHSTSQSNSSTTTYPPRSTQPTSTRFIPKPSQPSIHSTQSAPLPTSPTKNTHSQTPSLPIYARVTNISSTSSLPSSPQPHEPPLNSNQHNSSSSLPTTLQLDNASLDQQMTQLTEFTNDINNNPNLYYSACLVNNPVSYSNSIIVLDSGAFPHMLNHPSYFTSFIKTFPPDQRPPVHLADHNAIAPIHAIGTA